jgi:hypothetical protein
VSRSFGLILALTLIVRFPSFGRGFDSHRPLHKFAKSTLIRLPLLTSHPSICAERHLSDSSTYQATEIQSVNTCAFVGTNRRMTRDAGTTRRQSGYVWFISQVTDCQAKSFRLPSAALRHLLLTLQSVAVSPVPD